VFCKSFVATHEQLNVNSTMLQNPVSKREIFAYKLDYGFLVILRDVFGFAEWVFSDFRG